MPTDSIREPSPTTDLDRNKTGAFEAPTPSDASPGSLWSRSDGIVRGWNSRQEGRLPAAVGVGRLTGGLFMGLAVTRSSKGAPANVGGWLLSLPVARLLIQLHLALPNLLASSPSWSHQTSWDSAPFLTRVVLPLQPSKLTLSGGFDQCGDRSVALERPHGLDRGPDLVHVVLCKVHGDGLRLLRNRHNLLQDL